MHGLGEIFVDVPNHLISLEEVNGQKEVVFPAQRQASSMVSHPAARVRGKCSFKSGIFLY